MDAGSDYRVSLPAHPSAPGTARRLVSETLRERGVEDDIIDHVRLAVSELVTNAIVHTASPTVALIIELQNELVRLEVVDESVESPELRHPDPRSTGGRGLFLVDALAQRWGVTPSPDHGKRVWAEVACPGLRVTRRGH